MKKFTSILLTAVLLAAMFSVFAVNASAEESKTADGYLIEAAQLYGGGKYKEAAKAYVEAGKILDAAGNYGSVADAYRKAGACYIKANDWYNAAMIYDAGAEIYRFYLYDFASAADAFMKAGVCWMKNGDWEGAAIRFDSAATAYQSVGDPCYADRAKQQTETGPENADADFLLKEYYAAMAFVGKANAYWQGGDGEKADGSIDGINTLFRWGTFNGPLFNAVIRREEVKEETLGSTLSEGSLTVICSVACLAVGFLAAMFIFKKKNPALASGTESKDEE